MGLELWIDDFPQRVATPQYLDQLKNVGCFFISIMLGSSDGRRIWSLKDFERLTKLTEPRGIKVGTNDWIKPVRSYINSLNLYLKELLKSFPIIELEDDAETLFKVRQVVGFQSLREAARFHIDQRRKIIEDLRLQNKVRVGVDTFPGHPEHTERSTLVPLVDFFFSQIYPTRKRGEKLISFYSSLGPEKFITKGWSQVQRIPKINQIEKNIGIPLWSQKWPEEIPSNIIVENYFLAKQLGFQRVRGWSSKFALGVRKNSYALEGMRKIYERENFH